jgi:hypothetical protein
MELLSVGCCCSFTWLSILNICLIIDFCSSYHPAKSYDIIGYMMRHLKTLAKRLVELEFSCRRLDFGQGNKRVLQCDSSDKYSATKLKCLVERFILLHPTAKPAETLDTSGIAIYDNVSEWLAPIVLETCVNASVTQSIPFCEIA